MYEKSGKLYIVSTPIGNIEDITYRAIRILNSVDIIACEDTRESIKILNYYNIKNKLVSYHKYNEQEKSNYLTEELKQGKNIALITDQGTPLISDPGYIFIDKVAKENIEITSIPGACALINALVLSGISTEEFVFVGFLPFKNKYRNEKLESLSNETKTMVFYISSHKIIKDLEDIMKYFGEERNCALCREMTKKFEEVNRDSLKNIYDIYKNKNIKGEFVLVLSGKSKKGIKDEKVKDYENISVEEHFKLLLDSGENEKNAMKILSKLRNISKKEIYKILKVK